jgi:Na+/melibiose symporter-like transporter
MASVAVVQSMVSSVEATGAEATSLEAACQRRTVERTEMVERNTKRMLAMALLHFFQMSLASSTTTQIWQNMMKGNVAGQAKGMALSMSMGAAGSIMISPVCGVIADKYGRKPLLLLGPIGAAIARALVVWRRSRFTMLAYFAIAIPSTAGMALGQEAALADMYQHDLKLLAVMQVRCCAWVPTAQRHADALECAFSLDWHTFAFPLRN